MALWKTTVIADQSVGPRDTWLVGQNAAVVNTGSPTPSIWIAGMPGATTHRYVAYRSQNGGRGWTSVNSPVIDFMSGNSHARGLSSSEKRIYITYGQHPGPFPLESDYDSVVSLTYFDYNTGTWNAGGPVGWTPVVDSSAYPAWKDNSYPWEGTILDTMAGGQYFFGNAAGAVLKTRIQPSDLTQPTEAIFDQVCVWNGTTLVRTAFPGTWDNPGVCNPALTWSVGSIAAFLGASGILHYFFITRTDIGCGTGPGSGLLCDLYHISFSGGAWGAATLIQSSWVTNPGFRAHPPYPYPFGNILQVGSDCYALVGLVDKAVTLLKFADTATPTFDLSKKLEAPGYYTYDPFSQGALFQSGWDGLYYAYYSNVSLNINGDPAILNTDGQVYYRSSADMVTWSAASPLLAASEVSTTKPRHAIVPIASPHGVAIQPQQVLILGEDPATSPTGTTLWSTWLPVTTDCGGASTGEVGVAFSHFLLASGGTPPYTFAIVLGALPDGLTLNTATGEISGIPTTVGSFFYYFQVTDSLGIASTPLGCTIDITALVIDCGSPPDGTVGTAYVHTFPVTGGVAPFTFAIIGGALPPGLVLDPSTGTVTGIPTASGTFAFTIQVTDSLGGTATVTCAIIIAGNVPNPGSARTWLRGTRPSTDKGWSMDNYAVGDGPIARLGETTADADFPLQAVSDKLIAIGGSLFQFDGGTDAGQPINLVIETPAWDAGDARTPKYWGDGILETVTNKAVGEASDLTLQVLGDPIANEEMTGVLGPTDIVNTGGTRQLQITSVNAFNRTQGIRIVGSVADYVPEFYGWQPSWVPKPEVFTGRVDDWTDDGKVTNKYLMGVIIEGSTASATGTDLAVVTSVLRVHSASFTFAAGNIGDHLVVISGTGWRADTYTIVSVTGGDAVLDHSPGAVGITAGQWALGTPKIVQVQGDGGFVGATITVSHPGQTEFPYSWTPFETHEMRLVPLDLEGFQEFQLRWLWDDYPEYSGGIEDFTKMPTPVYVRGFELEASTKGSTVAFQVQRDLGEVMATPTVNTAVRDILAYGFATPFIASELRVVPLANWEKFNLRWVADPYPDFAPIRTPFLAPFGGHPAWIRGINIRGSTHGGTINVQVLGDGGALMTTIPNVNLSVQTVQNYAIASPFVAHLVQLVPDGAWEFFDALWEAEQYPELSTERTKVVSLPGVRFVQGLRLVADTGNVSRTFAICGEGEQTLATTTGQAFKGKQTIAFPRVNEFAPFYAHNLYLVPSGLARIWTDEIEWISEPAPDLGSGWTTPPVTGGFKNWWLTRYIWLGYSEAAGQVLVDITLDGGVVETYTFPASTAYLRTFLETRSTKSKKRSFRVYSSGGPFRLDLQGSFVLAKEWGRPYDEFSPIQVFGDASLESGARI